MKKVSLSMIGLLFFLGVFCQNSNTLLWKVTGNNLARPSFIYGTMHMICADDIQLSDSLQHVIKGVDNVYLELDIDNLLEMMGAMSHMAMRNDTTLAQLLSKDDYEKVKKYFSNHSAMLPFSILETYKPMLAESLIMEQSMNCDHLVAVEQMITAEAKSSGVKIAGLETMNYQLRIFDSIPYSFQAKQLVEMVNHSGEKDDEEMKKLTEAYRNQELNKMEELTKKEDAGMEKYANLLLYNRNANWMKKLQAIMPQHSVLVAVGAAHLPGKNGLLDLLKKQGYKVEPVKNEMIKTKTKNI